MSSSTLHVFFVFSVAAVLAVVAVLSVVAAQQPSPLALRIRQDTLYFEQHGRDDAREWLVMFEHKGIRTVKVDFNFRFNATECAQQQHVVPWPNSSSGPFLHGCFVLTHYYDAAVHDYATPSMLVDFLDAQRNADFLSVARTQRSGPVIVQMCLKNARVHCPVSPAVFDAYSYARLFDHFFDEVGAKIADLVQQNRVAFVFDSIGAGATGVGNDSGACFFTPTKRWPLAAGSTWTGNIAAALNNSAATAFPSEIMPNMDWTSEDSWQEIGGPPNNWGAFRTERVAFPIVAWEPASEFALSLWYEWYLSTNLYHGAGALIAFNEDAAVFHTITAATTKRFAHSLTGSHKMYGAVVAQFQTIPPASSAADSAASEMPFLLRCASQQPGHCSGPVISSGGGGGGGGVGSEERHQCLVECIAHERGNHSQFHTLDSTFVTLPAELTQSYVLPLRHMVVEQVLPWPSTGPGFEYRVTVADSTGTLHYLALQLSTPRPSSPLKFAHVCNSISPFGIDDVNGRVFSVNAFFDRTSGNNNGSGLAVTWIAAHLENAGPGPNAGKFPLGVTAITTSPIPAGGGMACPTFQLVLPETRLVADVCLNNTDCGVFQDLLLSEQERKRGNKKKEQVEEEFGATNWFGAGVGATADLLNGTTKQMRVIACYHVLRSVYCSSALFISYAMDKKQQQHLRLRHPQRRQQQQAHVSGGGVYSFYELSYAVPHPHTGIPVKVGVGFLPTVSFTQTSQFSSPSRGGTNNNNNTFAFLLRWSESFCQNTLPIDDNSVLFYGWHICSLVDYPGVPEFVPSPINSYAFARDYSVLEARLAAGNQHINGFASACDPELIHGVYDTQKFASNPILLPQTSTYDDDIAVGDFLAVQVASSLVIGAPTSCGSSLPGGGAIRLDSFPLPGMVFSYSNASAPPSETRRGSYKKQKN